MDRPRRSTRSSFGSSGAVTPVSSNNPYKKPTYNSSSRGGGAGEGTPTTTRGRRGRGRPPGRSSFSGGRANAKPECIAVRRSTGGSSTASSGRRGVVSGGRRSTYNSRQDYEYHYGSDFESDQNDSEPEDEEIESDQQNSEDDSVSLEEDNDNAESDSDYSVKSTSKGTTLGRPPSPPVPIWLDTDKVPEIPKLDLPTSSDDLLLPRELVVKAVEIYEPLRTFHQLVRLSPFRFEDFCAALACEDQSSLLAEIHIQLLKNIIREEDANGTLFGPNEVKDSVGAMVYFIDYITWPETLRSYLESDRVWEKEYKELISVEYPFCGPEVRIKILGWLVDQFLTTIGVREQLAGDGKILHEDHCRACNRLGELICCETCPAVYHLECITPPLKDIDNPPDDWKCPVCIKHQVPGVVDCCTDQEKSGSLVRHERLGYDRHGRKYWFLVRRLLVESEDGNEVWYYSTRHQIDELLTRLDAENYECVLVSNIKEIEEELCRQMEVTEEVTRLQNTHRRKTYLEVENGKEDADGGVERMTRLKSTGLYKLGQEGHFRSYVNHFTTDPTALSKGKHNEERDRKRHMSHKFSLTPASECKYGIKDLGGCPRATQLSALKGALSHMETVLPTTLMHVNWPVLRKTWITTVQNGASAFDFSRAMLMISACIRNAVYNPVWAESAGHVRLIRTSLLEREERKKAEKRDKKDKDEEEERLKAIPQFIKYKLPIRHQVYKQKGEEYRLHGRWGWIWLSNLRQCKPQDCRKMGLLAGPHKHVIQVKNDSGKVKTMLIDPGVYNKLMAKRNLTVGTNSNPSPQNTGASTNSENSSAPATEPEPANAFPEDKTVTPAEDKKEEVADHDTDVEMKSQSATEESQDKDIVKVEKDAESQEKEETVDKLQDQEKEKSEEDKIICEDEKGEKVKETVESGPDVVKMEVEDDNDKANDVKAEPESSEESKTQNDTSMETDAEDKDPKQEAEINANESLEETDKPKEEEVEKNNVVPATEPSSASQAVPMTPDKQETPPVRKKAETINVSSGLASTHRLLYQKVARRCEYLDSLLHRRLTLISLEEKQLRCTYGEEMVSKAKAGINAYLEEENRRKQEEDEYPDEEIIDSKLLLGGAYSFCCYSTECRKEAIAFMKGKGKNRERLYEKMCYSPMCRLKFCLQATTRLKQERIREAEKEKYFKVYKEIEDKRNYTLEGTSRKIYMRKLPECLTISSAPMSSGGSQATTAPATPGSIAHTQQQKKKKDPLAKYPEISSFQYATTKEPSILVLPTYELKKLARTAGRHFTPSGFLQNQKTGSWGWSYPCGRPLFRTAWQYRTTHAHTLAAAAMQLKILYASIKWDDIVAKIPSNDGKHVVHTDTEIVTTEILNHRIVGRFMERVQYLRRMMVVPIDAPKTIREITPSRIGLRKRKRAESPDKTEPVVTEDWVDEERLELWEIRYYGDRIDRKHERKSESNTPSTRTKSGIAIKQPEKYDPSIHIPEKKTYPGASHQGSQGQSGVVQTYSPTTGAVTPGQNSYDKTIEQVIRNQEPGKTDGGKSVSAVRTAELMRETIESEMKMQRAVQLSKRDKHTKSNGTPTRCGTPQPAVVAQPTASQQFQQQMQQQNNDKNMQNGASQNVTPGKVVSAGKGGVMQKKFFTARQNATVAAAATPTTSLDAGILTKRPLQNTITINKGAIAMMRNSAGQQVPVQVQPVISQSTAATIAGGIMNAVANSVVNSNPIQQQQQPIQSPTQKLQVIRLADGRVQVKGLLPGQHCFQGPDGKIHVTVSASQIQNFPALKQIVNPPEQNMNLQTAIQTQQQQQQQQIIASTAPTSTQIPLTNAVSSSDSVSQAFAVSSSPTVSSAPIATTSVQSALNATVGNVQQSQADQQQKVVQQQQFPQQVIVQQQNGQQIILQGAAAQAMFQNTTLQQKLLQQRILVQSGSVGVSSAGSSQAIVKNAIVTSSSLSDTPAVTGNRIVLQDGKTMIVAGTGAVTEGQSDASQKIVNVQQQVKQEQQQPQLMKPAAAVVSQGQIQIVQSQSGQIQLITQQPATTSIASGNPTSQQQQNSTTVVQSTTNVAVSSPAAAGVQALKQVQTSDGRVIYLSQDQLNELQMGGNTGRKIIVNNKIITLPGGEVRGQPQIIQAVAAGNQAQKTIQIVQGADGQQFLIHQSPQQIIQQQQSVQIRMPTVAGQITGQQQQMVIKKLVKTAASNAAGGTPVLTKSGNVLQLTPGAATQLNRILGDNKTLVRLANNQLATIQLSTGGPVSVASPTISKTIVAPTQTPPPTTPASASAVQIQQQQQTTITRTPGLPISIVSPSKPKTPPKQVVEVVSTTPASSISSGASLGQASPVSTTTPAATTPQSKPGQMIRLTPPILRASSSQATILRPQTPKQIASTTSTPQRPNIIASANVEQVPSTPKSETSPVQTAPTTPTISTSVPADIKTPQTPASTPVKPATATTPETSANTTASVSPESTTTTTSSTTPKMKTSPSKIVAQIFQTPSGPKVVIQGVNPGDLSPQQMQQLQTQIQKQMASNMPKPEGCATEEDVNAALAQTPFASEQTVSAMHSSPIETARSVASSPPSITSPLTSRSPIQTMVSPAKVLSPPASIASMMSKQTPTPAIPAPVIAPPSPGPPQLQPQASPTASVIVARRPQSRKSPIRPNNIDSPPLLFSPSPPMARANVTPSPPIARPAASPRSTMNNEQQQQQILSERKNSLKADIMEKKKQAATQMRLEVQREIQRKKLEMEKAKALEAAKAKQAQQESEVYGAKTTNKKRKSENGEATNNRNSEGSGSTHAGQNNRRGPRGRGGGGGGGRKRRLLCICKTPYDKDRFYVGCDKCQNWYHGDCIGISEEESKKLEEYICDDCQDDKLYCVCKQPYNDSQFYIQCDKCDDWLHGRCVGVLQGESEGIDDYVCPSCEPTSDINLPNSKKLDNADYMAINRLLRELHQNRASVPFRKPVSKSQAPNYFTIIKEPMDLQTIGNRVESKQYQYLRDFVGDVGKIFENCRYYNDSTSDTFKNADILEKFFVQKIKALRQSFKNRLKA